MKEKSTVITPKMLVIKSIAELKSVLTEKRRQGLKTGFVPTMGALHAGHISLITKAKLENDLVVVSIFVNPTQFNNPKDLQNYPSTPVEDTNMLTGSGADILFAPSVDEMYNADSPAGIKLDLGNLEKVMEGAHRPGHFAGVIQVVSKLFHIVEPENAYFGEKDFQQLAIIRFMARHEKMNVQIVACPTIREKSGLAMSSRNLRLTPGGRDAAAGIFRALAFAQQEWKKFPPGKLKDMVTEKIESNRSLKIEYIEIADELTLQSVKSWEDHEHARIFAAVFCEEVRLIDNVKLF
jgi:pantoate--beta-alanine ligase